jgi:hypothetical protein
MFKTIKYAILLIAAYIGFMVYANTLVYLDEIIGTTDRSFIYGAFLLKEFIVAALIAALFCFPLAKVFRQYSPYAALAVSLPVLLIRVPELATPPYRVPHLIISTYGMIAYVLLLVLGTWLVHKQLTAPTTKLTQNTAQVNQLEG